MTAEKIFTHPIAIVIYIAGALTLIYGITQGWFSRNKCPKGLTWSKTKGYCEENSREIGCLGNDDCPAGSACINGDCHYNYREIISIPVISRPVISTGGTSGGVGGGRPSGGGTLGAIG